MLENVRRVACLFVPLACAVPAAAQLRWVQRSSPTHPPTTPTGFVYADNQMTYDADRRVCVWTNGNETWEWDGSTWTNRPHAPLPVYAGLGITYDTSRHRTVFVSYIPSPPRLTVWDWDGTSWTLRTDQGGPVTSGRVEYVVQYDPVRDVVLLVGGQNTAGGVFLDTWQLSVTTWTHVGSAPVFTGHALAYDTAGSTMILYAPQPGSGATYERPNPTSWTSRTNGPSRLDASMVYDQGRQRAVLFGGLLSFGVASNETWEYDGTSWSQLIIPGPSARRSVSMAYDSHRQVVVLYGGWLPPSGSPRYTDTWELGFCPADFNHDGAANSQDLFDFLAPFFAGDTAADFNNDTVVNSQDFFDFVTAFFGGCA